MQFSCNVAAQSLLQVSLSLSLSVTEIYVEGREQKDFALRITMTFGNCRANPQARDESPNYIHRLRMCSSSSIWVEIEDDLEKCALRSMAKSIQL